MGKPDADFFEPEVRCDFLVEKKIKKVWAVQMEMLEKFDGVCKKHGLKYWAFDGTLLGAVRHQGFIPWDDDIDVAMFRDDYTRLQRIAPQEFTEPYFYQNSYTDIGIWALSKIRDSRTTGIEFRRLKELNQGIFMDIFPLDSVPAPGIEDEYAKNVFDMKHLLWDMVTSPEDTLLRVKQDFMEGSRTIDDVRCLLEVAKQDIRERFRIFEEFCLEHLDDTDEVSYIMGAFFGSGSMKKEWYQETVYLPFEHMEIPAPKEYDQVLTRRFGDYHKFVRGGSLHQNIIWEPDMPYKEYFEKYL